MKSPMTSNQTDCDQSGGFSVSAAKALFEAAKKPEIRNAAIAAAKNPFVRQTAKAVARDENARGAVLNAMKDPNASNKFNAAMAVASAKTRSSDDTPPPPPPHRGVNAPKPSDQHSSIRAKLENLHIGGGASSSSSSYGSMNQKASTSSAPPPPPPHKKSTDEPHGLALYDYTPTQSDEISLRVGDKIILKRYVDDQWVYGENSKTYQTGIIPLAYLNVVIPLPSSAKSFPSVPGKVYATALYDYNSQTPGDLSFFANQSIVVHSKINNEWLEGECSGQRGIFPANFVDCPNISQLPSSAPINPTPISGNLETVVAAFDYNSGVATDLQFNAGEIITIVEHVDSDWLMGELHGRRGLVPKTFLGSPYGSPSKEKKGIAEISSAFSPKKALAVSDYHSDDPKHLYVTRGDHLLIVEDVDEYYYRGKLESFKTLPAGILPKNIVKLEE